MKHCWDLHNLRVLLFLTAFAPVSAFVDLTLEELLFVDDTDLVAHHFAHIQRVVDVFSEAAGKIGLQIIVGKTELMYQPSPRNNSPIDPCNMINGQALKVVRRFKYLGSILSTDNPVDKEIIWRIQSACASYRKPEKRFWNRKQMRLANKCKVHKAVVLPALLYLLETYTLYAQRSKVHRVSFVTQWWLREETRSFQWLDFSI